MSIQAYAEKMGYHNYEQVAWRTLYTCGALTLGNIIAPAFFRNFNVKTHVFLGIVEGASLNLLFYNHYLEQIETKLVEFDSYEEETMRQVARITQFTIIFLVPLFLAKNLTSWFFQKISYTHLAKVGVLYNGAVAIGSLYGYEYMKNRMPQGL